MTLVAGGREQAKFSSIERFLKKEILKNPLPEGMGEAPAYKPSSRAQSAKSQRNRGSRKPKGAGNTKKPVEAPETQGSQVAQKPKDPSRGNRNLRRSRKSGKSRKPQNPEGSQKAQ